MKEKQVKIAYSEPIGYFPKEIRKKYKLGEYAEEDSILKYRSYYVYDFDFEDIQVAEGDGHDEAQALYDRMTKDCVANDGDKWAFDIALDCIRNMTNEECALIRAHGEIADFHFGYGMHVRNKYVHPSKSHFYGMADNVSSDVEKFIYAILIEEENA
jgi:hypothetical protein